MSVYVRRRRRLRVGVLCEKFAEVSVCVALRVVWLVGCEVLMTPGVRRSFMITSCSCLAVL